MKLRNFLFISLIFAPALINASGVNNTSQAELSIFWVIPFIGILLSIAIFPLINAHFWEKNLWWICLGIFCIPMAIIFSLFMGEHLRELTFEKGLEYLSFIILLLSLFTISGGILIKGALKGTPVVNSIFLFIGSIIASFIGTTGASMLLIRPLLRANENRKSKAHIVIFFIFLVSNLGGLLTPLGDPPLFLGYLQGIPFTWTFRLIPEWAFACSIVLAVFYFFDLRMYKREIKNNPKLAASNTSADSSEEKFGIDGKINLLFLLGIIFCIYMQGMLVKKFPGVWPHFGPQEAGMLLFTGLSLLITPLKSEVRIKNGFTFGPIKEVALIFAGIFATMIPALYILEQKGAALGIIKPWQFFWATGLLSSFLDNAPTYLTFLSVAKGLNLPNDLGFTLNDGTGLSAAVLAAISCGAVFMGANTYIGNGPNFMVRSIAEESGVKMPSFFGYMLYSGCILIPIFVLITFIFFR